MSPQTTPQLRREARRLDQSGEASTTVSPPRQAWQEGFGMAMRVLENQKETALEIEGYRAMNEEMRAAHADLAEASLRSLPAD